MTQMAGRDLVLGVNLGRTVEGDQVRGAARLAEESGFDVVTAADHLGAPAPFAVLATAAAVTERVRLRSYVLDVGFWNPALLAREAATLDALSGGRLELGLGAGHMRHEHEDAGLPFPPLAGRVEALERTIVEVRRRLADPGHAPQPMQRPVPVVVGCWGAGTLRVAARQADVVSLGGLTQIPGERAGTFRLATSGETADRVARLAGLLADPAGGSGRRIVVDALLQRVVVDRPPERAAAELEQEFGGAIGAEDLLDTPFVLLAHSPGAGAQELLARATRYGITSWMTHATSTAALASVLRELR
jgi:probable F420-dependent oxidoreductase